MKNVELIVLGSPDEMVIFTDFLESLGANSDDLTVEVAGRFEPIGGEVLRSCKYVHLKFKKDAFNQFKDE